MKGRRQRDYFRKALETKQMEVLRDMRRQRPSIHIETSGDWADRLNRSLDVDFSVQALDQRSTLLDAIRAALRRLDSGEFGNCVACGERIPQKRLRAIPWTRYCVSCQEMAEASGQDGDDLALAS